MQYYKSLIFLKYKDLFSEIYSFLLITFTDFTNFSFAYFDYNYIPIIFYFDKKFLSINFKILFFLDSPLHNY